VLNISWLRASQRHESKGAHGSYVIRPPPTAWYLSSYPVAADWLAKLIPFQPSAITVIPADSGDFHNCLPHLAAMKSTLRSLTTRSSVLTEPDIWSQVSIDDMSWASHLTSLTLQPVDRSDPELGDQQLVWFPSLLSFTGGILDDAWHQLPASLTSLDVRRTYWSPLGPGKDFLAQLPSLTHLHCELDFNNQESNEGAIDAVLTHPSLTSIGGTVWNFLHLLERAVVSEKSVLHRLKSLHATRVPNGFTNFIRTAAPNVTAINYGLHNETTTDELKSLAASIVPSSRLTRWSSITLTVEQPSLVHLLSPLASLLVDLTISINDGKHTLLFSSLSSLTSLTKLTFYRSNHYHDVLKWYDTFINHPHLPYITFKDRGNVEEWLPFIKSIPSTKGRSKTILPTSWNGSGIVGVPRLWFHDMRDWNTNVWIYMTVFGALPPLPSSSHSEHEQFKYNNDSIPIDPLIIDSHCIRPQHGIIQ
jgi:hypothetical protein